MLAATESSITSAPIFKESKRLHITPLTESLLPKVLGSHLQLAQNVTFHQLPNFPNRSYGFVTLPVAEAAMVKRKLHGTILRGEKVAIEDARDDVRKEKADIERQEDAEAVSESETPARTLRKRKREDGVISGAVELPQDRKVKRGWTEPKATSEARKIKEKRDKKDSKDEKKSATSKAKAKSSSFTDKEECLFQTAIPSKSVDSVHLDKQSKRKSKRGKQLLTVHEFENTTKHPSYLRQANNKDKKVVQEYDEDKGWVDEEGNVVEAATKPARKRKPEAIPKKNDEEDPTAVSANESTNADETTSSGSSSESDESDGSDSESDTGKLRPAFAGKALSISAEPEVSITEPSPVTPHPLETLFKKPKPPTGQSSARSSLEINTSFSFFGGNDDDANPDRLAIEKSLETPGLTALKRRGLPNLSIPVTPYTQRDMHWRSQRSAAPTPDTAAPGKSGFGDPFGLLANIHMDKEQPIEEEEEEEEEEEGEEESDDPDDIMQGIESEASSIAPAAQSDAKDGRDSKESDFAKWFWENRGANTRAWKKRKREAMKDQKKRDSRRRKI